MLASFLINQANEMWGRKWRFATLYSLREGPLRFSQIKNHLPGVSVKVLSEALRDLEEQGLIIRRQYNTIPVKVTYELHPHISDLIQAKECYVKGLIRYFYENSDKHLLPEWVISSLQKEYLTAR